MIYNKTNFIEFGRTHEILSDIWPKSCKPFSEVLTQKHNEPYF